MNNKYNNNQANHNIFILQPQAVSTGACSQLLEEEEDDDDTNTTTICRAQPRPVNDTHSPRPLSSAKRYDASVPTAMFE